VAWKILSFSSNNFSDRMALFPVRSNPGWQPAAILENYSGIARFPCNSTAFLLMKISLDYDYYSVTDFDAGYILNCSLYRWEWYKKMSLHVVAESISSASKSHHRDRRKHDTTTELLDLQQQTLNAVNSLVSIQTETLQVKKVKLAVQQMVYAYSGSEPGLELTRNRKLVKCDKFFLTLCRLHAGLQEQDLMWLTVADITNWSERS